MLNTSPQRLTIWDALLWWLDRLVDRPRQPAKHFSAMSAPQVAVGYVDIGRKYPIPADRIDYYYQAAD